MRKAKVWYKNQEAGVLAQLDDGSFVFTYLERWIDDPSKPPVSLTLPKANSPYRSDHLFAFFYSMLPEGTNKHMVCYNLRIDKDDDFGILMATAGSDTVGAVQVTIEN